MGLAALTEDDGKPIRSVARGGLDLGGLQDAEEKVGRSAKRPRALIERIKALASGSRTSAY